MDLANLGRKLAGKLYGKLMGCDVETMTPISMKRFAIVIFSGIAVSLSCSPARQYMPAKHITVREKEDTSTIIQVIETDFEARQRSDYNKMLGRWVVTTMRRQQKAELENLSNVYFELNSDSTCSGKGGCNDFHGRFSVKGSSIKFNSIVSTKMACANMDTENAFLTLLENRISAYTYRESGLLLRDGASNIVFECRR